MQTLLIEINDQKAFNLLQELEQLHILRIVKENVLESKSSLLPQKKPSDFFGIFTKKEGEKFDSHIQQMRGEWERNT